MGYWEHFIPIPHDVMISNVCDCAERVQCVLKMKITVIALTLGFFSQLEGSLQVGCPGKMPSMGKVLRGKMPSMAKARSSDVMS